VSHGSPRRQRRRRAVSDNRAGAGAGRTGPSVRPGRTEQGGRDDDDVAAIRSLRAAEARWSMSRSVEPLAQPRTARCSRSVRSPSRGQTQPYVRFGSRRQFTSSGDRDRGDQCAARRPGHFGPRAETSPSGERRADRTSVEGQTGGGTVAGRSNGRPWGAEGASGRSARVERARAVRPHERPAPCVQDGCTFTPNVERQSVRPSESAARTEQSVRAVRAIVESSTTERSSTPSSRPWRPGRTSRGERAGRDRGSPGRSDVRRSSAFSTARVGKSARARERGCVQVGPSAGANNEHSTAVRVQSVPSRGSVRPRQNGQPDAGR
jgi:hypothetical protein